MMVVNDQDLAELENEIRDWIIDQFGTRDEESLRIWHRSIVRLSAERMRDESGFDDAVMGIACEGIEDLAWPNTACLAFSHEWEKRGLILSPFNHWLLGVYLQPAS